MNLIAGQYAIHRAVIGQFPFLSLTDDQFALLEHAHKTATEATELEEKFDVLIGNFFSFEKALLEITLEKEIWWEFSHADFQYLRREVNRKLLNLLSTCRFYQDSKLHHIKEIFGVNTDISTKITQKNSGLYDGSFSFRFMETLRNYAQHRSFAISTFTLSGSWIDAHNPTLPHLRRQGVSLGVDLSELDSNFKTAVLEEAKTLSPFPDLKFLVREYVDGIRKLHGFIRENLDEAVTGANNEMNRNLDAYKSLDKHSSDDGVAVIKMNTPPTFEVMFYLFSDRTKYRTSLVTKNRVSGEFAKSYISSEVLPQK